MKPMMICHIVSLKIMTSCRGFYHSFVCNSCLRGSTCTRCNRYSLHTAKSNAYIVYMFCAPCIWKSRDHDIGGDGLSVTVVSRIYCFVLFSRLRLHLEPFLTNGKSIDLCDGHGSIFRVIEANKSISPTGTVILLAYSGTYGFIGFELVE